MKKNFTEIEEIIENRITVLEKEYDLDRWDIQEIRTEAYRENKRIRPRPLGHPGDPDGSLPGKRMGQRPLPPG